MMEVVRTYETSVYFNETRGAISQKALIFELLILLICDSTKQKIAYSL
jgi:hypothetical protein